MPDKGDHYRLVDGAGRLVAIGIPAGGGRVAPDKVLVAPDGGGAAVGD